ncbi:MAG TPA: DUF4412 domain-containing protein [Blastocatellia bacterium]|nr:DUF4412 domain-containing protein [Blastocatellia bacterium]
MFRRRTGHTFGTLILITLTCLVALAAACSRTERAPSNNSKASASSTASSAAPGGGEFEGIIAMKMDTGNQKGAEMTYLIKGQRTRIETKVTDNPEGQAVMLWDTGAGKMTTLIPSRKMYMTMDLKETAEGLREAAKEMKKSKGEEEAKFPKLTDTGKQETIAGYQCEHWLMGDKQDVDICVAKGLGYFGMGGQTGGGFGMLKNLVFNPRLLAAAAAHPEWVKFLQGGAFPLKLTTMEDGKVRMTMEATRIERKSLDDSLFIVPSDYKELDMHNPLGGKQ